MCRMQKIHVILKWSRSDGWILLTCLSLSQLFILQTGWGYFVSVVCFSLSVLTSSVIPCTVSEYNLPSAAADSQRNILSCKIKPLLFHLTSIYSFGLLTFQTVWNQDKQTFLLRSSDRQKTKEITWPQFWDSLWRGTSERLSYISCLIIVSFQVALGDSAPSHAAEKKNAVGMLALGVRGRKIVQPPSSPDHKPSEKPAFRSKIIIMQDKAPTPAAENAVGTEAACKDRDKLTAGPLSSPFERRAWHELNICWLLRTSTNSWTCSEAVSLHDTAGTDLLIAAACRSETRRWRRLTTVTINMIDSAVARPAVLGLLLDGTFQ